MYPDVPDNHAFDSFISLSALDASLLPAKPHKFPRKPALKCTEERTLDGCKLESLKPQLGYVP
jgi:hypothetical protein